MVAALDPLLPRPASRWSAALGAVAIGLLAAGFAASMLCAPAPGWPADSYRIVFLHWPALWLSVALYAAIAVLSIRTLRGDARAGILASALAPTGLMFTFLALWTGALWAKPLRGTWWTWEAPLVLETLLFLLYGGFIALKDMVDEPRRAERSAALLAIFGAANLPLLYLAIRGWEALRPGLPGPGFPFPRAGWAAALALVTAGFAAYALSIGLRRARCLAAEQEWIVRSLRGRPGAPP